ncbi:hypothetical protein LI177_02825 [bacterium 210820-DFI.6.37]|nr:hypothetical protein [bacterium 210820-DFI.6.37]
MTRQEAISKHRKMWRWLAKNPGKWKEDYLAIFDPGAKPCSRCYLCEYAQIDCADCPLEWPGGGCCSGTERALYPAWHYATYHKKYDVAAEIAKQIAELPERELK